MARVVQSLDGIIACLNPVLFISGRTVIKPSSMLSFPETTLHPQGILSKTLRMHSPVRPCKLGVQCARSHQSSQLTAIPCPHLLGSHPRILHVALHVACDAEWV